MKNVVNKVVKNCKSCKNGTNDDSNSNNFVRLPWLLNIITQLQKTEYKIFISAAIPTRLLCNSN